LEIEECGFLPKGAAADAWRRFAIMRKCWSGLTSAATVVTVFPRSIERQFDHSKTNGEICATGAAAIIVVGNSQICFHKIMTAKTTAKKSHSRRG
jgi:hypothetical protein